MKAEPKRTSSAPTRVILAAAVAALVVTGIELHGATSQAIQAQSAPSATGASTSSGKPVGHSSGPAVHRQPTASGGATHSTSRPPARPANFTRNCGIDMSSTKPAAKPRSCQVLVIGDSLGQGLASGFMQQLHGVKGTRIINKAKASTGLSNWWFYDWSTQLPPMLKKYKPHLVVVMLGGNDHQNMSVNKDVVKFGSDDWVRIYSSRIQKIISLANASGAYVAWVGLPIAAPVKYSRAMRKLNSYYSEVASRNPQAVYIPTWDYFATASGAYRETARVGNQVVDLRSDDGIHFSIAGYGVLGTYVLKQLSTSFHVRLGGKHPKTISG